MAFSKIGTFVTTKKIEIVSSLDNWNEFRKQANTNVPKNKDEQNKEALDKEADFEVVATINTDKFIYVHTTIMAGVTPEKNGYWITPETEKYINDNNDSWTCKDLLKDYKTFKRATTFVEHDQKLENAKGKCIDCIARNMGDTILIDVLFSVDKRHTGLIANIENGIINAVSMGCSTEKTVCSICGNEAVDSDHYCTCVKQGNKGRLFKCKDGKTRKSAEICKNNTFFDVSLVANPAFAGAVFRKILSSSDSSELSNHLLATILNSKIESFVNNDEMILKTALVSDIVNISLKSDGAIEIKTGDKIYQTKNSMNQDEINNFKMSLQNINKPIQEEKMPQTMLSKILQTVFGKKQATHPILNLSEQKNFSISDQNFEDIPYHNPHNVIPQMTTGIQQNIPCEIKIMQPIELKIIDIKPIQDNEHEEKSSRVKQFECIKCGFSNELWKVKAASIDSGHNEVYECPNCFFIIENSLFDEFKHVNKLSSAWFKQWKNDNNVFAFKEATIDNKKFVLAINKQKIVLAFNQETNEIHSDYDIDTLNQKSNILIASSDIPVDKDEDCYWFDEQGNSVISKGEKVFFITTVENGEYGLFKTSSGEDFFMPMSYVTNKMLDDMSTNNKQLEAEDKE